MADRWFTSDLHFDHYNIIRYCGRPFDNVTEMNDYLLTAYNEKVKPQDRVYNLGDITMRRGGKNVKWLKELIGKMNGHKILFPGNHDHFEAKEYLEAGFEDIRATWRDDVGFIYSHIPIHPDSMGSAKANVHGHIHDAEDYHPVVKGDTIQPYLNISIEKTDYKPIHIDELTQLLDRKIKYWREQLESTNNQTRDQGR